MLARFPFDFLSSLTAFSLWIDQALFSPVLKGNDHFRLFPPLFSCAENSRTYVGSQALSLTALYLNIRAKTPAGPEEWGLYNTKWRCLDIRPLTRYKHCHFSTQHPHTNTQLSLVLSVLDIFLDHDTCAFTVVAQFWFQKSFSIYFYFFTRVVWFAKKS